MPLLGTLASGHNLTLANPYLAFTLILAVVNVFTTLMLFFTLRTHKHTQVVILKSFLSFTFVLTGLLLHRLVTSHIDYLVVNVIFYSVLLFVLGYSIRLFFFRLDYEL